MEREKTVRSLEDILEQREQELKDKQEELDSQRGMLSTAIDELVKNNQILKERNQELNQLLYQSSHSLKSPISSIQGIINLLQLEALTSNGQEYVAHLEKKTNQMFEVLNALTSLSKVTKGEINQEVINLDMVIKRSIGIQSSLAKKHQVTITYSSDNKEGLLISNAELLCEVLRQVISNALFFRDNSRPGVVEIALQKSDDHFIIEISDDGDGIDALAGDHIFEMFYRGSGKSGGTGVGLFIAKRAMELLQGKIEFSTSAQGSTFKIYLPNNFNASSTELAY